MKTLFDLAESNERKRLGMELACGPRRAILKLARTIAITIALAHPDNTCTADDVQEVLHRDYGLEPSDLGPAAGSIFRSASWRFTGRRIYSAQVNNHGRELRVWRYTP